MKLNYECLRKVLLTLEETLDLDDEFDYEPLTLNEIVEIPTLSNEFPRKDIAYCVYKLGEAELILCNLPRAVKSNKGTFLYRTDYEVNALTYKGHEFASQIRQDTVWNKTSKILGKVGVCTIKVISDIAADVIANLISANLQ